MKSTCYHLLVILTLGLLLTGCHSRSKVIYIQNATELGTQTNPYDYSAVIKRDDQLSIIVNSKDPELAAPFNMNLTQAAFIGGSNISTYSGGSPQAFWVDSEGNIEYPTMGKIHVEGMTRHQLAELIQNHLKDNNLILDPVVNITFQNFQVSVLGEVNSPGRFTITSERISIFDAIAKAGDLTIFGERDKVRLLREEDGKQTVYTVDLRDANLITTPYYYLHQNDVLYVEPNKSKATNREVSNLYTFGISLVSLAMTMATFIRSFN
jgi:polysaccharide export outer membrane protein